MRWRPAEQTTRRGDELTIRRYNEEFHRKWVSGAPPGDEVLLGRGDIQSLADLGNNFRFVEDMRIVPFGIRTTLLISIMIALPGVPLLLLVIPLDDILSALARIVL